ncbi:4-hydroxy-tetrahydrodipicolinate synthase [Marmoricola endophyticus]|uniref:4-hydroxy-tetrahydrodipicolinate synthase n=1 Tax=Marmoricola endophyticus TaxID=2040280 RepID=A0A917BMY4_9ACTN|nr:4-hydroxy-tetrahydrodipicolinate synthase [Marmoricola endophyticus]GGF51166.1 4-hydroxy-tetrahydrodipicolinate synthase [Marmoricola endophyticus]
MTVQLRGSIAPLVTPFREDDTVDHDVVSTMVERQIAAGAHGISVAGTTGEPIALSLRERMDLVAHTAQSVAGRVPFVPATGSHQLGETLELTKQAQQVGADAAMVILPYYSKPTQEGLFRWFAAVAESTDLPLLVYNIPSRTSVDITPETVARLRAAYPHIVGMKEANKDFEHANRVLDACGRDFLVFSGLEMLCLPLLAIGGAGHISVTANIFPAELVALYELTTENRWDEARDLHFRLMALNDAILTETNPTAVKWVLSRMGLVHNRVREPLQPLSDRGQTLVRSAMESLDLGVAL